MEGPPFRQRQVRDRTVLHNGGVNPPNLFRVGPQDLQDIGALELLGDLQGQDLPIGSLGRAQLTLAEGLDVHRHVPANRP